MSLMEVCIKRYAKKASLTMTLILCFYYNTDGFMAKNMQLTIINLIILNFPPLICLENKRIIQLAIILGPHEPKDLMSFLTAMLNDLKTLQKFSFDVISNDRETYRAKVHLLLGTF